MMGQIIGQIRVSPNPALVGESVLVEVIDPLGNSYDMGGETIVRINGVLGSPQYLQFEDSGQQEIIVAASRNGNLETEFVTIDVIDFADTTKHVNDNQRVYRSFLLEKKLPHLSSPPILRIQQYGTKPYLARFYVGNETPLRTAETSSPAAQLPSTTNVSSEPFVAAVPGDSRDESVTYVWDFGLGQVQRSRERYINFDFESSLDPDEEHNLFHVILKIEAADSKTIEVKRTLYIHNSYALSKRLGTIVPRVESSYYAERIQEAWISSAILHNYEKVPLTLDSRMIVPMFEDGEKPLNFHKENLPVPIVLPGKRSTSIVIRVHRELVPIDANGFSVVFCGTTASNIPVRASAHFRKNRSVRVLPFRVPPESKPEIDDLLDKWGGINPIEAPSKANIVTGSKPLIRDLSLDMPSLMRIGNMASTEGNSKSYARIPSETFDLIEIIDPSFASVCMVADLSQPDIWLPSQKEKRETYLKELYSTGIFGRNIKADGLYRDPAEPKEGEECNPENTPKSVYDNPNAEWACQATTTEELVTIPGNFRNAWMGDIVLSPGGNSAVAEMLRKVSPPQLYSHCGIMTRNHYQITHSTGIEDRIEEYPVGDIDKYAVPLFGLRPDVVKYVWPGVVTQEVEKTVEGGDRRPDPEKPDTTYDIRSFTVYPTRTTWEWIYPMVVKPKEEQPTIRKQLQAIAEYARDQEGHSHYRFFCYTDPTTAFDADKFGPPDVGWAKGTWPSVCSSFIWTILRKHNVHLEGKLEELDTHTMRPGSAVEVDSSAADGLYLYSAEERRAAGNHLFLRIKEKSIRRILDKIPKDVVGGFLGSLLLQVVPRRVGNQICNAFARDETSADATESEDWKSTGAANAVSPDDILHWDSPVLGGLYGFAEQLHYHGPRPEKILHHEWRLVYTAAKVTGTVMFQGQPVAGAKVWAYDAPGASGISRSDGTFDLPHVPTGFYTFQANAPRKGSDDEDMFLWTTTPLIEVKAPETRVDLVLQPPKAEYRRLLITGYHYIREKHGWPFDGTEKFEPDLSREVYLDPSHYVAPDEPPFELSSQEGGLYQGRNASILRYRPSLKSDDLSITVSCDHAFFGGDKYEGETHDNIVIPRDSDKYYLSQIGKQESGEDHCYIALHFSNQGNPH
jgi:hypothetical protein